MNYRINKNMRPVLIKPDGTQVNIDINIFIEALNVYNKKINTFYDTKIDIASILGMRNLSAVIGELFVHSFAEVSNGLFIKNPHQDGYPDLLLMDTEGIQIYKQIEKENLLQEKHRFSPFASGGLEVKATCGSIPSQKECNKKGVARPDIGVQRIDLMKGYDWKAHHRGTNNLIGITWDFINSIPTITSIQFSSSLSEGLWGKIVQPKEGGGRTTSVSIMTREGVATMLRGWLVVIDDEHYINFFEKYNSIKI